MFRFEALGMLPIIAILLLLAWLVLSPPRTISVADAKRIAEQHGTVK